MSSHATYSDPYAEPFSYMLLNKQMSCPSRSAEYVVSVVIESRRPVYYINQILYYIILYSIY